MKRVLLVLLALSLVFCTVACSGEEIAITFRVNGATMMVVSTNKAGELRLSAPNSRRAAECVGWCAQKNDTTVFLPIGATYQYEQGETTVFEPVYLAAQLSSEMGMMYAPDAHGITMAAQMNTEEWGKLLELAPSTTCGVLATLVSDLTATGNVFTHQALVANEISANDLTPSELVAGDNGMTSFTTLLTDIPSENYWQAYTAIGYALVTYTDGSAAYFYFSYDDGGAPSTSVRSLASAVFSSMTAEEQDALSDEEKEIFKSYLSSIRVMVEKDPDAPGKIKLDSNRYDVKAICDTEAAGSENEALWLKIFNLLPINHERALYITLKDGTALNEYNVAAVIYMDGTAIPAKRYYPDLKQPRYTVVFFEGALIIGYSNFSPTV